jgi:hypothetical protein
MPYCTDTEFSDCSSGLLGEAHYNPAVGIPIQPFVLYRNSIWSRKKASSLNSIYEKSRNIPKRRSFPAEKKQRVTRAFTFHCSILRNQPGTNCSHSHTACSEYKPPDLTQTCPSARTLPPVTPEGLTPNRIALRIQPAPRRNHAFPVIRTNPACK